MWAPRQKIYHLILDLAKQGKTVVINTLKIPSSARLPTFFTCSTRGASSSGSSTRQINQQTVMLYSTNSQDIDRTVETNE